MKVEHEVSERAFESRSQVPVHREPGAGNLGRSLEIEDPKIRAQIPMGLRRKRKIRYFTPMQNLLIVALVPSQGNGLVGKVRHLAQEIAKRRVQSGDLFVQLGDAFAHCTNLRLPL